MILMEVTGNSQFSLPIFAVVMAARWCGNLFGRGIYDMHIIEMKRVPLLEHVPEADMLYSRAMDVMARDVVSIDEIEMVSSVHAKLSACSHNGFPVLREGKPVGLIGRNILHYLLNEGERSGLYLGEKKVVRWEVMMRELGGKQPELKPLPDHFHREMMLDVRPYMTKDYFSMNDEATTYSCYQLFRQLGLRTLLMTNSDGRLTGVITRKDLILVEAEGMEEEEGDDDEDVEESDQVSIDDRPVSNASLRG
mmetsp:Transcript_54365/g.107394  ORF Transcript_54365/g.107394 Transcript_54365/m.107394 type:complete len:251 (-) Transcript_54365:172-924(-)